jgi:hypothetical protein
MPNSVSRNIGSLWTATRDDPEVRGRKNPAADVDRRAARLS